MPSLEGGRPRLGGGGAGGSQVGAGRSRQSGGGSQLDDGDGDVDDDFDSDPPEFVDRASKRVDINNLRVTQLPYNPSVCMPWALDGELELRLHQVKVDVRDAV